MALHPVFQKHVVALREVFGSVSRQQLVHQRRALDFNLRAIATFADHSASDAIERTQRAGIALFLAVERGDSGSIERARPAALRAMDALEAELAKGKLNENAAGIGF